MDPFMHFYSFNQPFEDNSDADVAQDGNEFDTAAISVRKTPRRTDEVASRRYSCRTRQNRCSSRVRAHVGQNSSRPSEDTVSGPEATDVSLLSTASHAVYSQSGYILDSSVPRLPPASDGPDSLLLIRRARLRLPTGG